MADIKIYTTPFCPYCIQAKRFFDQNNLVYEDVDVSSDQKLRQKISQKYGGFRTVPMIAVGETFIGGYTELMASVKSGEFEKLVDS